jgi:hypothetical protein
MNLLSTHLTVGIFGDLTVFGGDTSCKTAARSQA